MNCVTSYPDQARKPVTLSEQTSLPESEPLHLHPASPLFAVWDSIKTLALPIFIALATGSIDYQTGAMGIGLLASLYSIAQCRVYRYWLTRDQIVIKQGVLFRSVRHVPVERIQNVQITENILHRMLGVGRLQLESASGNKPEAIINVLSTDAIQTIRDHVHNHGQKQQAIDTAEPTDQLTQPPLLTLNFADMMRCGLLQWRGPVILGAIVGAILQNSPEMPDLQKLMYAYVAEYFSISRSWGWVIYGLVLPLSSLVSLWLASTFIVILKYHGFTLWRDRQKLAISSGLLTRRHASVPTRRVQLLRVHNSPIHRLLKRISVSVETAGGTQTDANNSTINLLAPVLPAGQRESFLKAIQHDVCWDQIQWQPVEPRAWRRVAVRLGGWLMAVLALLYFSLPDYMGQIYIAEKVKLALFLLPLLLVFPVYWYSRSAIRNMGYHLGNDVIGYRRGVWFKSEVFVRLSKIQSVVITETPFDRRHNMASLAVDTAGAKFGSRHLKIPYLGNATALQIEASVIREVAHREFVW